MNEPPEPVASDNASSRSGWLASGQRRPEAEGAVRPSVVGVALVLAHDLLKVALAQDEEPLEAVLAYGAHPPLGTGIRLWGADRSADVYLSDRRDAATAGGFFVQALAATETRPVRVTSAKARCSPPALRAVLPQVEHRTSDCLNNRLERDQQHLKGRGRPVRRFKRAGTASTVCRGHALVRNLLHGFSPLTAAVLPRLRLATAWPLLAASL